MSIVVSAAMSLVAGGGMISTSGVCGASVKNRTCATNAATPAEISRRRSTRTFVGWHGIHVTSSAAWCGHAKFAVQRLRIPRSAFVSAKHFASLACISGAAQHVLYGKPSKPSGAKRIAANGIRTVTHRGGIHVPHQLHFLLFCHERHVVWNGLRKFEQFRGRRLRISRSLVERSWFERKTPRPASAASLRKRR